MQSRAMLNYQAGLKLYEGQQYEALDELLQEAISLDPESGRLIELQGLLDYSRRRHAEACCSFERASALVPLSIDAQLSMADVYTRFGRKAEASTILNYLASRSDLELERLPALAAGFGRIGEYQLALETCREALRREADFDEALYGMAFYMHMLNYPLECILPLFRRALSLVPDSGLYRLSLAMMCARGGCWQESYQLCCGLEFDKVGCVNCLKFMLYVFNTVGDCERRAGCLNEILSRAQRVRQASSDSMSN